MAVMEDTVILYANCIFGTLGLITNAFVLVLTRTKEIRQKEYTCFIFNRVIVDFLFCFHCIFLQPIGISHWIEAPNVCLTTAGICSLLTSAMVFSEPLLAYNRYISICHTHLYASTFRKRNVYFMCALAWTLSVAFTAPHVIMGNLGRADGVMCQMQLTKRSSFLAYIFCDQLAAVSSYLIIIILHFRILAVIKRHQNQGMIDGQRTRLQEDKDLLKCITIMAIFPMLTGLPTGACSIIYMNNPNIMPDAVLCASNILFLSCPIANPLATVFMVRPIRKQASLVLRRLFKCEKNLVVPIQSQVTSTRNVTTNGLG